MNMTAIEKTPARGASPMRLQGPEKEAKVVEQALAKQLEDIERIFGARWEW